MHKPAGQASPSPPSGEPEPLDSSDNYTRRDTTTSEVGTKSDPPPDTSTGAYARAAEVESASSASASSSSMAVDAIPQSKEAVQFVDILVRKCHSCFESARVATSKGFSNASTPEPMSGVVLPGVVVRDGHLLLAAAGLRAVSLDEVDAAVLELQEVTNWVATGAMELLQQHAGEVSDCLHLRDLRDAVLCIGEEMAVAWSPTGKLRQMDSCQWPIGLGDSSSCGDDLRQNQSGRLR